MSKSAKASRMNREPSASKFAKRGHPKVPRPRPPVRRAICVDFSAYNDNTQLGPIHQQAGFVFAQLGPAPTMFVNATAGQIGLQFPDAGLAIIFAGLAYGVTMKFGTFAGPVTLEARDGARLVSTQTINTANLYTTIVLNPSPCISSLIFRGGRNEAILVQICVKYCQTSRTGPQPKKRDAGRGTTTRSVIS